MASRLESAIQIVNFRRPVFYDVPNVDMDKYAVIVGRVLGTESLSPCFAVCVRGTTARGEPVLGLWHKTFMSDGCFAKGFEVLKAKMIQQKCLPSTIETFIIGGEDNDPEEEAMLAFREGANIRDCLFNLSKSDEDASLSVVLTPEKVYVSKAHLNHLFTYSEENADVGDVIFSAKRRKA